MKLSIGTVSKIFDISKDTLRYYDKIGILKPKVNKENNYRYYDFRHIEQLGLILGIKYLGISLSDIKETIAGGELTDYKTIILRQEEIIKQKINELTLLNEEIKKIHGIIDEITSFENEEDFSKLIVEEGNETLYGIEANKLLLSDIKYSLEEIPTDGFIYAYTILNNETILEDESIMYFRDVKGNLDFLKDGKPSIHTLKGSFVTAHFYGTIKELTAYILKMNTFFNAPSNNNVYLNFKFYLPKNEEDIYYVKIKLYINLITL
ncbi:MAG: MerR family transcriptional regulator [Clostridium sp.]